MILRIRPSRLTAPTVRVVMPASDAGVVLALVFSMLFVTLGLACFTVFCWKAVADLGEISVFPFARGFPGQRALWLFLAALAWLFAKLIGAFVNLLKSVPQEADELPTGPVREFVAASE